MTVHKFDPPPPSVMLKWVFSLQLHTRHHKMTYPLLPTCMTSFMNGPKSDSVTSNIVFDFAKKLYWNHTTRQSLLKGKLYLNSIN